MDYTLVDEGYQLQFPMEIDGLIPTDDSVRLLNALLERMDYRKLYRAYSRVPQSGTSPKSLFKIEVYGYMSGQYSSRSMERSCRRDINFMYLLGGDAVPDHNTIARFRSRYLPEAMDHLYEQLVDLLAESGELSLQSVFVDGTKVESFAGRYTFVWKKRVEKALTRLRERMKQDVPKIAQEHGIRFGYADEIEEHQLKHLLVRLGKKRMNQGIDFVHGRGSRKTALQRAIEQITDYYEKLKRYQKDLQILKDRNSYAKTDQDATFMRMKEDHMRNGQLKPAYNVTIGVDSEYIIDVMLSQERSDSQTLLPFLERIKRLRYKEIVADAGYESEENYAYLEENGQLAFIKPSNYEQAKTRKYKSDIGRRENMPYDEASDAYTCTMGYPICPAYTRKTRSKAGYLIETTIYECPHCEGCSAKERCIRPGGSKPIEERSKRLYVSKEFLRQRAAAEARITTERGILLRINRSIQVEGAFGILKQDMGFRRFLLRGMVKVQTEIMLLCFAYNIRKLHMKIQSSRCGAHLHQPTAA